jgi:small subunit ribosomal protein S21|tara:strand:- start:1021 stop:1248 length:228 start_codon:yes stop_codon:yes gene_type:complete
MAYREPRQKRGLTVEVRNNDINRAWRKLKRLLQDEGVMQEIRDRKHFVKPSEKRARKKAAGRARWLKKKREIDNQ